MKPTSVVSAISAKPESKDTVNFSDEGTILSVPSTNRSNQTYSSNIDARYSDPYYESNTELSIAQDIYDAIIFPLELPSGIDAEYHTKSSVGDTEPEQPFSIGDIVDVQERTWPGINKPGGVARIIQVHLDQGGVH
jgi:hypothetical protein